MWFGCKNSKSQNIFCYKNILSKKKSYQINSSSDVHLFLGITENAKGRCAGEISNLRSNWLIFRANVICQRMNYTSLNVRLHISVLDYINFSKFWFVFQHFTCRTYYRQTAEPDEETKMYFWSDGGPSDRRTDLMKNRRCTNDLTDDRKYPWSTKSVVLTWQRTEYMSFSSAEGLKVSFGPGKGSKVSFWPDKRMKVSFWPAEGLKVSFWPDKLDLKRPSAWTEGKPSD